MAAVAVFDASALIALFSEADSHHSWALKAFGETAEYHYQITALTLAEVLVHPIRSGKEKLFLENLKSLEMEVTAIDMGSALELARLRSETGLRMPDAVVLNQCNQANGALVTADSMLATRSREIGIEVFAPIFE